MDYSKDAIVNDKNELINGDTTLKVNIKIQSFKDDFTELRKKETLKDILLIRGIFI